MPILVKTIIFACVAFLMIPFEIVAADEIDDALAAIATVGSGGKGSASARQAADRLAHQDISVLPRLFEAMDTPNVIAANWYRTAYTKIVDRELERTPPRLPIAFLKKYVRTGTRQGRARRLALELIERTEPDFGSNLIPTLLDDTEFREEAIDAALARGDAAKKAGNLEAAKTAFESAFRHARDSRQISTAATKLASVGHPVDIVEHMGFVIDWMLLGPFDAPGITGFTTTFPPETKVDLEATYPGKTGTKIGWKRHTTDDRFGQVNLNRAIATVKEAVGYAYTEFESTESRKVQLRCGADDNITVWLNGKKVFSRLQWLNGTRLDRFTADAELKKGHNRLLIKVCQGPQHKNPAVPNNWSMQLRFCDADGRGIRLETMLPAAAPK